MDINHISNVDAGSTTNGENNSNSNNSNESTRKWTVVPAVDYDDVQQRPRSTVEGQQFQPHHLLYNEREEALLYPWRDDAVAVTDELYRLIVLENNQTTKRPRRGRQSQQEPSRNSPISAKKKATRLNFFEFCYSLKMNHPNIHKVKIKARFDENKQEDLDSEDEDYDKDADHCPYFPNGRLQYIGNALLQNTLITELVVDVEIMHYEMNDMERASSLLEFIQTSTVLRKVGIHNSSADMFGNHLAGLILEAMQVNESIQELDLLGACPVRAVRKLMSSTTSLRALHIDCGRFTYTTSEDRRIAFLEALALNRSSIDSLSLTVCNYRGGWKWFEQIPQYVSNGAAMVRSLTLNGSRLEPPPSFYELMSSTSLHTLEMKCSWEHLSELQNALATNNSIENLKLTGGLYDVDSVRAILHHLHNGPSTLRKLALKSCNDNFPALQKYLCHTTAPLQRLELEDCIMTDECMICLLSGQDTLNSTQSEELTQVEFKSCEFSSRAMHRLAELVAGRHKLHDHQHPLLPGLVLLSDKTNLLRFPPEIKRHPFRFQGGVLVSMSTTLLSPPSSEISSDRHPRSTQHCISLSTYPSGHLPLYCDDLMTAVKESCVVCLQLSHIGHAESLKLALYLPHLMSLSALHLINIEDNVHPATILKGLRGNGSLLMTSFLTDRRRRFFRDVRVKSIVQSYCHRNRFLSQIILRKIALCNVCTVDVENVLRNNVHCESLEENSGTVNHQLVLLPTLLRVANVIPLIKTPFMLAALLESNGTIGPHVSI